MTRFQEALLEALADEVRAAPAIPAGPTPRPRWVRPALVAAAAAVAVAAGVVVAGALAPEPAYAVTRHHDGTVSLTMRELADPGRATRDLRAAGVRSRMLRLSDPGTCPAPAGAGAPWQPPGLMPQPGTFTVASISPDATLGDTTGYIAGVELPGGGIDNLKFTFAPAVIPAAAELVVVEYPENGGIVVVVGLTRAPAPACWERAA